MKLLPNFSESKSKYLVADSEVLSYHKKVGNFSFFVNKEISEKHPDEYHKHPYPTAESALYKITADIFSLHRSILCLSKCGWTLAAPIILRTMMELLLSIKIITNKIEDCEYFGFKYMYSYCKEKIRNNSEDVNVIEESKRNIETGLSELNDETRKRAKEFLQQSIGKYWYNPEYKTPADVIEKFGSENIRYLFKSYSGTTHGGFLGLNITKGQPDDIHPHPRADKKAQNFVLSHSSRILLDSMYCRGIFSKLEIENIYQKLVSEFLSLRKTKK